MTALGPLVTVWGYFWYRFRRDDSPEQVKLDHQRANAYAAAHPTYTYTLTVNGVQANGDWGPVNQTYYVRT